MMELFYDIQIFGFLFVAAIIFALVRRDYLKRPKTFLGRHRSLARITMGVLAGSWLIVFYGSFIEPNLLTVTRQTIEVAHAPKTPITIALLSDFHVGPYKKTWFMQRIVRKTLAQKPDMVLIAGDFVTRHDRPNDIAYLEPLRALASEIPTYAVLGNHDEGMGETPRLTLMPEWKETTSRAITALGVRVLKDEVAIESVRGERVLILGIDDIPEDASAPKRLLAGRAHDAPWIALGHHPEFVIQAAAAGVDLYLTGHTHGGQVRLPFWGSVIDIPTVIGNHFDHGLRFWGRTPLFITRGLGESGARARLFAPPEIVLITLK